MASLGLDLGDDDILNDGNDGSALLADGVDGTAPLFPRQVIRVSIAAQRMRDACCCAPHTRTGVRRPALPCRPHTAHARGIHEAMAARTVACTATRSGAVLAGNLNPTDTAVSRSATCTIARGRCRPPGQQAGCTLCGHVEDTSPTRGPCFTVKSTFY